MLTGIVLQMHGQGVSAPILGAAAPVNNEFQFTLSGTSNAAYVVEASTNLQTWFALRTNKESAATRVLRVPAVGAKCFYRARTALPLFGFAIAAQQTIDMNGNNLLVDSFDSRDPNYSTNGKYDVLKGKDGGDVAGNSGLTNSINIGNAQIYGRVLTGSNGSTTIGPIGSVGSLAWHGANRTGIEPGWLRNDLNMSFAEVSASAHGAFTPSDGEVAGEYYEYVLQSARFLMSNLTLGGDERMYVLGDAELFVTTGLNISGNASIIIANGASLRLYVGATNAVIGGNGIVNSGDASRFIYHGLPSNTQLNFSVITTFTGCIYAPNAQVNLSAGGVGDAHFVGASVSRSVSLGGHFRFHYDEALRNIATLVF